MTQGKVYIAGKTSALAIAGTHLLRSGIPISDSPDWAIRHILLDVPSFPPGTWTSEALSTLLASVSRNVIVWGGNTNHPILQDFETVDLLKDETYLLKNAAITADCTLPIAQSLLTVPWQEVSALVIGWGRIGKILSQRLKNLGCHVTIASRNLPHREDAAASGFDTVDTASLSRKIPHFHLIVNTAPAPVLSLPEDVPSIQIDLASEAGLTGRNVLRARGLPGRYAPERSGRLIADTFLRLSREASK